MATAGGTKEQMEHTHNEWEIINGIWYYFDENGYMLADTTTPDGYYVDVNGAWVN